MVFPAHAGMSLKKGAEEARALGFPRSRGDEPPTNHSLQDDLMFSPLTRG